MELKKLKARIYEESKKLGVVYEELAKRSRRDYVDAMNPGEMLPKQGTICTQECAEIFRGHVEETKASVLALIEAEQAKDVEGLSTAPGPDAVNAIQILRMRKNISELELKSAMERYGKTPMARAAIQEIADDHGVFLGFEGEENDYQTCEELKREMFSVFSADTIMYGGNGYISTENMLAFTLENRIPEGRIPDWYSSGSGNA